MDGETARSITPSQDISKVLQYTSYITPVGVAGLALMGRYVTAALALTSTILLYQVSQYRLAIRALQDE